MNARDWARVKPLLALAAELPSNERERFINERCDDPALRTEILDLLASPAPLSAIVTAGALQAGDTLGPYMIDSLVGRGGMGEVYRAHDSRLGREVAIKILPPLFAADRERLDRFAREAKLLAALNHPHICTLHDIGSDGGRQFLVMEYVEGGSLADRLAKRPLPIADALRYAIQIADALDKAHARGVVHRDLKPANVIITTAGAKLLDFGLARNAVAAASLETNALDSPQPHTVTEQGAVIGTWPYMAPEQIEGRKADARSDIWAFGCLLHEMLTGRRAFEGKTQASLIAAILEREPALATSEAPFPDALRHVIQRCLAKNPDDRWQSAADVRHELEWIASEDARTIDARPASSRLATRVGWTAAAVLAVGALALAGLARKGHVTPPPVVRLSVEIPDAAGSAYLMQLSPDGRWLAYEGYRPGSTTNSIWLRNMDTGNTRALSGTEGRRLLPFWSPDARSLGFFAGGKLKRIDVATEAVQVICDAPSARGGAWSRGGTIVFAPAIAAPLFRVEASGGAPVQLTSLDVSAGEQSHRLPAFADDGVHFVFTVLRRDGRSSIRIGSFERSETAELVNLSAGLNSPAEPTQAFVVNGQVVFARGGAILAQPLDPNALRVTGEPVVLATHVDSEDLGRQPFTVSERLIVYRQHSAENALRQLRWIQRNGADGNAVWKPADFSTAALAPDGDHLAVSVMNQDESTSEIWVLDTNRGTALRLTDDVFFADDVVWSADGATVFYGVWKGLSISDIYSKRADGSADAKLVVDTPAVQKRPVGRSADGDLLFTATDAATGRLELRVADPRTGRSAVVLADVRGMFNADVTADGRFIAYELESGASRDVYVQALAGGPRVQVSTNGGQAPEWRGDGKELYYVARGQLVAAKMRYEGDAPVVAGNQSLFAYPADSTGYLPGAGGQRFLLLMRTAARQRPAPAAIVNWMTMLQKQP